MVGKTVEGCGLEFWRFADEQHQQVYREVIEISKYGGCSNKKARCPAPVQYEAR